MALRESVLNGYSPTGKVLVCVLWRKVRFLKGERGKPIYWCMLFRNNSLLSFLVFFHFLYVFVLIFFLFPLALFFFSPCEIYPLFFDPLYRAWQGPLYSACRDQCFTVLPLNRLCLVWVYLPNANRTKPLPDRGGFILSFCAPRTHFVLLRAAAFPATMSISSLLTLRACTQRFPLKFSLLGGPSSQQDVPPKEV